LGYQCILHHKRGLTDYKLVVVGGGSGGLAVASRFAAKLPSGSVAVVEPKDVSYRYLSRCKIQMSCLFPLQTHYYQPLWTLVGAGIKDRNDSRKTMASVMPKKAIWIKEAATEFNPQRNSLVVSSGREIKYEFLVVALGNKLNFDAIPGLVDALKEKGNGVCSNYSFETVNKTWESLQGLKTGNAVFTFPNTPVKCAGAPQKIMYLTDDYLRRHDRRKEINIIYNTSLSVIFGAPKYAERLLNLVKERDIQVNFRKNLIAVDGFKKIAEFENLDSEEKIGIPFSMLHVTPPQSPHTVQKPLADVSGYVAVNKKTLRHETFKNVFGIGDCTNAPTSKTAAAVAAQSGIVVANLSRVMKDQEPTFEYDGYTSCPLVTSYKTAIMAEFDYDLKPKETFFFDQGKERRSMYFMKKELIPKLYWQMLA
jgi:sulfide:quinone oxidoreductase